MKKFIISFIATIIGSWLAYKIILFVLVFLLQITNTGAYLIDVFLFFLPLVTISGISIYFFVHKNKEISIGIFIAGLVACLIFGYGALLMMGEMGL